MTLTAAGNLLVGTPSDNGYKFATVVAGSASFQNAITMTNATDSDLSIRIRTNETSFINSGSNGVLTFATNSTERARITSSGDLLVGTDTYGTTSAGFCINGNPASSTKGAIISTLAGSTNPYTTMEVYSTGASAYRFYVGLAGTVYATNTSISAISDIRFKENIRDLDTGLSEVMALKPRLYDWKEGKGANTKNARGFIAQEFEQVFPDLIDEWKDPAPEGEEPYKSVRQDLIPVLVKAIQEQQEIIDSLKARLDAANF
jgi:hypothetical protein